MWPRQPSFGIWPRPHSLRSASLFSQFFPNFQLTNQPIRQLTNSPIRPSLFALRSSLQFTVSPLHRFYSLILSPTLRFSHCCKTDELLLRDPQNLFYGRNPIKHLHGPVLAKGYHSLFHGLAFNGIGVRGLQYEILDRIIHAH